KFREDMKDANLTINFPHGALNGISKDGYVASTAETYIKQNIGEEAWKDFDSKIIGGSFESEEERINAIASYGLDDPDSSGAWGEVYERANAEYSSLGLHVEDQKPTYIA